MSSPDVVLQFYKRLYPFKAIFQWLNHEHTPSRLFTHREFAFTLQGDIYLRYNSFASADDLKKQVVSLNPTRFEIGPVYSARPRDKKTVRPGAFTPLLRELVFDIDMTDYDPIRTCCSGADICSSCWAFIAASVSVLHSALTNHFGFKHILWVYSGRRGIHAWVSDREALELTDEQRRAVVGHLTVVQGGSKSRKVNIRNGSRNLPPSLQQALQHLRLVFPDIILGSQDLYASEEKWKELLELIPDKAVVEKLSTSWRANPGKSSEAKWIELREAVKEYKDNPSKYAQLNAALEDIVLYYTYPRLDAEVSKHRNHLLKAPFCVHPSTGRVCVPVDPEKIDDFKPENVPTVSQLLTELDSAGAAVAGEHLSDWERTSLKPYVAMLEQHAMKLMEELRKTKKEMDTTW